VRPAVLAGILLALFLPLLQDLFRLKRNIEPLKGSFEMSRDTSFSWTGWFDGGYQQQKEKFLRDSFGLHDLCVRLNNQVNFNLFKKAGTVYVVVGKENYLYEVGYFNAYFGEDFVGEKKLDSLAERVRDIQDTLRRLNKLILPVLAPGKASFYPEFIPDKYRREPRVSNYLYLSAAMRAKGVDHLDFNRHFIEQKHRSDYPLYPQYGIHWSDYGAIMAFDSIVRYVELKLDRELPEIVFTNTRITDTLQNTDDDVIKAMNLLWEPRTFPMGYPSWNVKYDSTRHHKPRLLVIADSFWWYIYSTGLPGAVFKGDRFWFYNEAMYPESYTKPIFVKDIDHAAAIRNADVILILHSEATLSRFGRGFADLCHEVYFPDRTKENPGR
jgi:hypothetical protein